MDTNQIIFWLLLLDSLIANFIAYFGVRWYVRHFRILSRFLPITKAWAGFYLVLVLFIGYLVY